AEDLITDGARVVGVRARAGRTGGLATLHARVVVLATGGIGHLYAVTTNPAEASGIGLAVAARAGAVLADTEFVQFHPTAIATGQDFPARFPTVYASCMAAGINPMRALIPVAPAAHYHMGGVRTDVRGRTSLDGLWAAGEVASSGVHGANRLASNSLLEAVVFANRVAEDISGMSSPSTPPQRASTGPRSSIDAASPSVSDLRTIMSQYVGVLRRCEGHAHGLARLSSVECET